MINQVVAKVGEDIITLHDLQQYAPVKLKQIYAIKDVKERKEKSAEYYDTVLNTLINSKLLEIGAARFGVFITPEEINNAILAVSRENIYFQDDLINILEREQAVTSEVEVYIKDIILKEKLKPLLIKRVVVTDYDIERYLNDEADTPIKIKNFEIELGVFPNNLTYEQQKDLLTFQDFEKVFLTHGTFYDMGWVSLKDSLPAISAELEQMRTKTLSKPIFMDDGTVIFVKLKSLKIVDALTDSLSNQAYSVIAEKQLNELISSWQERLRNNIVVVTYNIGLMD